MNTLIRLVLLMLLVIGVATYVEVIGINDTDLDEITREIDQRMAASESRMEAEIANLNTTVSELEQSIANLQRALGREPVANLPVSSSSVAIAGALGPGRTLVEPDAANARFGPALDALELDNQTRGLALEALTGLIVEHAAAGQAAASQSTDEYLASRTTQQQLDQDIRAALSDILTRAQIDQVIAHQDVNREVLARAELRGAEEQLIELGLADTARARVMDTLVTNFKRAQTLDSPSIGGGAPQPAQIAHTGHAARIDGIFLARESLGEQLSDNDMIAVDTVLNELVNQANLQVEAARALINQNAGIPAVQ